MFTNDNTNGCYTTNELATLNEALAVRTARGEIHDGASDAINNAWQTGATVADLTA
jgi:hypothetical protein